MADRLGARLMAMTGLFSGKNFLQDHSLSLLHVPFKGSGSLHKLGYFFHNCHCKGLLSSSSILHNQFNNQVLLHCMKTAENLQMHNSTVTHTSLSHTDYQVSDSLRLNSQESFLVHYS